MSSRIVFNQGPEMVSGRHVDGATAHYSWKLAGMFRTDEREGYALNQALSELEVSGFRASPNSHVFIGSSTQMIKLQRRLGIAAGKIAHESGQLEGDTGVRYIGERLYDLARDPSTFIDHGSGNPLPFHRALGKIAVPFADMIEDDLARCYFDLAPAHLGLESREGEMPISSLH